MLPIAGQMSGPIGLKFFVDNHGGNNLNKPKKYFQIFKKIFFFLELFFATGNAGPFS